MTFSINAYQNEYLPEGVGEMHAVIKVTSAGGPAVAPSGEKAVVLVVDTSGSMSGSKIRAARRAAAAAINLLPDGTLFALVSGNHEAHCVYSHKGTDLVRADDRTRAAGVDATRLLRAGGGTAISTWIDETRDLLEPHRGAVRLAYLVTDGQNVSEPAESLEIAIDRSVGVFQCDTRGVGVDWEVGELRKISSALLGTVDIIKGPEEMESDFRAFLDRAIGKNVPDVRLRVWGPEGSRVRFLRQVHPAIEDLSDRAVPIDARAGEYLTGAWAGDETREYHICVEVPPGPLGHEKLAGRLGVVVAGEVAGQALVRAVWTDDEACSTRINPEVAHCTGQAELAQAIQDGLQAREVGDSDTATVKLGRALDLATAAGNEATLKLLSNVVDRDAAGGTVRLRGDAEQVAVMELDTRSTRTTRLRRDDPAEGPG